MPSAVSEPRTRWSTWPWPPFPKRPRFSALPPDLRNDVRAFFGTYKKACQQADALLYSAGNLRAVSAACERAGVGKLLREASVRSPHGPSASFRPCFASTRDVAANSLASVDGMTLDQAISSRQSAGSPT